MRILFIFEKEQKVFEISGVKVGGQPGEYPTVLIGTIFYDRHKIVSDPMKGIFDKKRAEELLNKQDEMSDNTGNPYIVDVVGNTAEALTKYIDFVASIIDGPFLVDSTLATARIEAIRHAADIGLTERAIYNSIESHVKDSEISALKEIGVKSAVVLAFNPRNPRPEGRTQILEGYPGQVGLLKAAEEAGVQNILVDTAVLDVPSIGFSAKAIELVKQEFGLPAGCAPSNATTTWEKIKKGLGPYAYNVCSAVSGAITIFWGANFILYGPIENAEAAFPAYATADLLMAYYVSRRHRIDPKTRDHPLFKILR